MPVLISFLSFNVDLISLTWLALRIITPQRLPTSSYIRFLLTADFRLSKRTCEPSQLLFNSRPFRGLGNIYIASKLRCDLQTRCSTGTSFSVVLPAPPCIAGGKTKFVLDEYDFCTEHIASSQWPARAVGNPMLSFLRGTHSLIQIELVCPTDKRNICINSFRRRQDKHL